MMYVLKKKLSIYTEIFIFAKRCNSAYVTLWSPPGTSSAARRRARGALETGPALCAVPAASPEPQEPLGLCGVTLNPKP